jgi:hypothetical protein
MQEGRADRHGGGQAFGGFSPTTSRLAATIWGMACGAVP